MLYGEHMTNAKTNGRGGRRPGAGRPPVEDVTATEVVQFRVSPGMLSDWQHAADMDEKSLSEWIRNSCVQYRIRNGNRYYDGKGKRRKPAKEG